MAPRPPESLSAFLTRLTKAIKAGQHEIRFGQNHFSHAVCVEDGAFRVRRLETTREDADAYMSEHGTFMPEHNEMIAKPRTLIHEADSLEALGKWLKERWPL